MSRTIITVVGKDTKGIIARVCTYLGKMNTSFETVADELADLGKSIGVQVKCQREEIFNMMHRI